MTIKRAEKIMGLTIRQMSATGKRLYYEAYGPGGVPLYRAGGYKVPAILNHLIAQNYQDQRQLAMQRAKWRCEECGSYRNLECHHKIARSRGRVDSADNLTVCCSAHHQVLHGRK